jgi:predicted transcriptional regulator of viral defense system
MKIRELELIVRLLTKTSHSLLTTKQLANILVSESIPVRKATIQRAVKSGLFTRVCRGLYAITDSFSSEPYKLEAIAKSLRHGEYSYLSLESVLSEYSVISQIPLNRVTVMTTGRKQVYDTPFGIVELTHTARSVESILDGTAIIDGRPLRQASLKTALEDQRRVNRNIGLIDYEIAEELLNEFN